MNRLYISKRTNGYFKFCVDYSDIIEKFYQLLSRMYIHGISRQEFCAYIYNYTSKSKEGYVDTVDYHDDPYEYTQTTF